MNYKIGFHLLLIITLTGCGTKLIILQEEYPTNDFMPGGCYYMRTSPECMLSQFIIEIVPVELDTIEWFVDMTELENYTVDSLNYIIPISPPFTFFEYSIHENLYKNFGIDPPAIFICKLEKAIVSNHYTKEELQLSNFIVSKIIVAVESTVLKIPVSKKPNKLKDNQFFYEKSNWCGFQLLSAGSH